MVLLLDDNAALLGWLEAVLRAPVSTPSASERPRQARKWRLRHPDLALLDVVLPDGDGVLALELRATEPRMQIILMTGTELSPDEAEICERYDIPVLRKPFLGQDAISLIQARMVHSHAARGGGSPLAGRSLRDRRAADAWQKRRRSGGHGTRAPRDAVLARRYRTKHGEIDIVARTRDTTGVRRGQGAEDSRVRDRGRGRDPRKQRRLVSMAPTISRATALTDVPADSTSSRSTESGEGAAITVYPNAFDA